MPYLNLYLENIDREKNDVHLIYWNRDLNPEETSHLENITKHEFVCLQQDDVSKFSKIGSFLKFRKFAKKVLKEKYDFIIILHSLPGVILLKELLMKYKQKYIFDYRDFTYENIKLYKQIIHTLVKNSFKTFVSSDAFRKHLPEDENKIFTTHNVLSTDISYNCSVNNGKSPKIRIGFWGFIREEEINLEIIRKIGNDIRFELHYYGREQAVAEKLKEYVKKNGFQNVFFHGEYEPSDRYGFAQNTDIIHNIYAEKNMMLAMSNKYYDGVIFRIPQILMTGSFMAENAEEKEIGFAVNPYSDTFAQDIYDYFQSIDMKQFSENCEDEKKRVLKENERIVKTICLIVKKK